MSNRENGQKTFILGVGAQKCGTSWYYNYLVASGFVATNTIKEYHIWDALFIPGLDSLRVKTEDSESNFENRLRFFMQESTERYFAHFDNLMKTQGRSITCDITPLYSGLSHDVFGHIDKGFAQRNIVTKAVFLMRDPLERCWSAARMESRNDVGHTRIDEDAVVHHSLTRLAGLRTRYDVTVGEIEAAFESPRIHLGIYEEMFAPDNLDKLSVFSGVPTRKHLATNKVNVSKKTVPLGDKAAAKIATHYRSVYDFAAKRFPQTTRLWPGFNYL